MSVLKENAGIQDFKFGQLIPQEDNQETHGHGDGFKKSFELKSLNAAQNIKHDLTEDNIRTERNLEAQSPAFSILDLVKEHRGLNRQAEDDFEKAVADEVERRLEEIGKRAYQEGIDKGMKEGHEQAHKEAQQIFEEHIQHFTNEVERVRADMDEVLHKAKEDAYLMVKNLTKWIILKEVDEKYYLARLLEKLIHEINTKSNLVLHVNESSFGYMPEIIKIVERKVGKLTNVRVEVDLDQTENGVVLESENTIIDGSLESQFNSIDKLFKNVGVNR